MEIRKTLRRLIVYNLKSITNFRCLNASYTKTLPVYYVLVTCLLSILNDYSGNAIPEKSYTYVFCRAIRVRISRNNSN